MGTDPNTQTKPLKWHTWFAWYPVRAENYDGEKFWVWLEDVIPIFKEENGKYKTYYRLVFDRRKKEKV